MPLRNRDRFVIGKSQLAPVGCPWRRCDELPSQDLSSLKNELMDAQRSNGAFVLYILYIDRKT